MKKTCFSFKSIVSSILIALFFVTMSASAQTSGATERLLKKAENKYRFAEYNKALPMYLDLLKSDPTNFLYNYRAGVCYLKSNMETAKSVKYFEEAKKNKAPSNGATFAFYYYMGYAYHLTNRFDDAIECFTIAKTFHNDPEYYPVTDSLVNREIAQCEIGKKLMANPSDIRVFNLGTKVNSIYPDYSPVVVPDLSAILYTSTRKGSTGGKVTIEGGDFFEDLYLTKVSKTKDSKADASENKLLYEFSSAENIQNLNTNKNDASIAVSTDGKSFYVFSKGRIRQVDYNNGKFGTSKDFKCSVISKNDVAPSLFFADDGNTLFFVSSRSGGFGGKDIYVSTKQKDGTWGEARNLGSHINTSSDEESPFFDSFDKTLYFSSQGHNSMGGYDVFKSKFQGKEWASAENLGYPVNSGADDIFYAYNRTENVGYYTTMREDNVGNYDIYALKYIQPLKVSLIVNYAGNLTPKNLKVTIIGPNDSSIVAVNPKGEASYKSNREYKVLIPRYNNDSILDTLRFKTPETFGGYSCVQEIIYEPVKNYRNLLIGYKTTVYNAFFDVEKDIEKSGARNTKVLMARFPMCDAIKSQYSYYSNPNLTKDEEYLHYIKTLKPDHRNFKAYSQTSYIDTSSFALIYKMQDSIKAKENALVKKSEETKNTKDSEAKEEFAETHIKTTKVIKQKETIFISDTPKEETTSKSKQKKHEDSSSKIAKEEAIAKTEPSKTIAPKVEAAKSVSGIKTFNHIYFERGRSELDEQYDAELKEIADYLRENENLFLEINGYADSVGTTSYNNALSEDRALIIKRGIMKHKISTDRIKAIGRGEVGSADDNKQSRRAEFVIVVLNKNKARHKKD